MKRRSRENPIARAVAKRRMGSLLADIAIKAHLTADDQVDRDLIANLAFVIGLGAEVSVRLDNDLDRTKRLHAALRTLLAMSVDGGRWQAAQTSRLYGLAKEGQALAIDHVNLGMQAHPAASALSARIAEGVATMADVAWAEVYA